MESLVKKLGENDSKHLRQKFDSEELDLVNQKRFYPYEHICNLESFNKTLPSKSAFHGSLSGKGISDKEYQHVNKVWNKFQIKGMKDFYHLHLKCDVLLLADVFENFRNRCQESYALCPSRYLSSPALSCDAVPRKVPKILK